MNSLVQIRSVASLKLLSVLSAVFFCLPAISAEVSSVQVTIAGLHSKEGKVWVCLWSEENAADFPHCDTARPFAKSNAPAGAPFVTFTDIPSGKYAVSMFHDEKGTGTVDMNFAGFPKSGIGLSNNPEFGLTSRPTFAKAGFTVPSVTRVNIQTRYMFK